MRLAWAGFSQSAKKRLLVVWLIAAGLLAVYGGAVRPGRAFRGIAMERTSALAAIETILSVAEGNWSESQLAAWIRNHTKRER